MRGRVVGLVVAVLVVVAAVVVTAVQRAGDDPAPGAAGERTSAAPSPVRSAADLPDGPADAPLTIPSVRSVDEADGPGWAPSSATRVIADPDGPLADEAELLADELAVETADGEAEPGDIALTLDEDADTGAEGYRMETSDHRVEITAETAAGAFYGTRTLLQSVREGDGVAEGVVTDRPDRPQRGLMVDIARKHFPAEWIADRMREMADLKLNQLHLHLSDDQAFRIESESHPEVVSDPHLTKDEVRDLLELAETLHITVIPEIDSPGHLGAVLEAHPDLQLTRADGTPAEGGIDIANPRSGELIDELLTEYAELFPGPYFHIGGDEYVAMYSSDPEATYPELAEAAREEHGPDAGVQDLATSWLNARAETVRDADRTPQVWNDGMHAGGTVQPGEDREVTYWTGREVDARPPEEYLEEGYQLVNLSSEYVYYVLGEPNEFTYPTGERIYQEWDADVLRGSESVPEEYAGRENVLGGRFAIWCDLSNAQTPEEVAEGIRLPLHAVAQKLWDPAEPELDWGRFTELADRVAP